MRTAFGVFYIKRGSTTAPVPALVTSTGATAASASGLVNYALSNTNQATTNSGDFNVALANETYVAKWTISNSVGHVTEYVDKQFLSV
eukprot:gene1534-39572_t